MRLGAESRNKVIVTAALVLLALALFARMLLLERSGPAAVPERPAAAQEALQTGTSRGARAPATASLDPTLRLDLLRASEDTDYTGSGRNIFQDFEEPPLVVTAGKGKDCVLLHPGCPGYVPPKPPPPPIDLRFFGFANSPGERKQIFLSQGDDVFIGKEGDIIQRRYRILKIGANSVEIEDVLNNNRQVIVLTPPS